MKEKVKRALHDAFGAYWKSHQQVKIDGRECAITSKYVDLHFSDDVIDMLCNVIYSGQDKKTITGTLEGNICGNVENNYISKNLSVRILSVDYMCEIDENNLPVIHINNAFFQSK